MASNNHEEMILEVGVNYSNVDKALEAVRRRGSKLWKDLGKSTSNYSKSLKQFAKTKGNPLSPESFKKSTAGLKVFENGLKKFNISLNALHTKLANATEAETKGLQKQINLLKQAKKLHLAKGMKAGHVAGGQAKGKKAVSWLDVAKAESSGKELGLGAAAAIMGGFEAGSALLQKDLGGIFKSGGKIMGNVWKTTFAGAGKGARGLGNVLHKAGDKAQKSGGHDDLATMSKTLGSLFKSVGPMLNMVSKLGPMFELAASSVFAIVKLLIDAEAQAKEINKEILKVSGSSDFWYSNMKKGGVALADMGTTLEKVRDSANSWDNQSWGINAADHAAFLSTMGAEGVGLKQLEKNFAAVGDSAELSATQAKTFGGTVQVAVAYSRQFGATLQEIGQFQAELMTELGQSTATTELGFKAISEAAAESGIAANKFYGIIRGLTADMHLYNTRTEDTVKIMGKLGKVMSPKNAQKFMSTFMQGMKGKGREELVKTTFLNGVGATKGTLDKGLDRKAGKLAQKELGGKFSAADVLDKNKSIDELVEGVADISKGTVREAIQEMRMDKTANGKGAFGTSMALGNASMGDSLDIMENVVRKFAGGKDKNADGSKKAFSELVGELGPEMIANTQNISPEELRARMKMSMAVDDQRKLLAAGLKDDKKRGATLKKLKDAGISTEDLTKVGTDALLDTMDDSQKEQFKAAKTEEEYSKETSKYQDTVMDKLGRMVEFLMNQIYKVMMGVWDSVVDVWAAVSVGKSDEVKQKKAEIAAAKTKDMDIIDAVGNSGGDPKKVKSNLLESEGWKKIVDAMGAKENSPQQDKLLTTVEKYLSKQGLETAMGMQGSAGQKYDKARYVSKEDMAKITQEVSQKTALEAMGKGATPEQAQKVAADWIKSVEGVVDIQKKGAALGKEREEAFFADLRKSLGDDDYKATLQKSGWVTNENAPEEMIDLMAAGKGALKGGGSSTPSAGSTSTSSTSPSAPAAITPSSKDAPVTTKQADEHTEAVTQVREATDQVHTDLRTKGIKMDRVFTENIFWKEGKKAVLEASREALFEYFMYSKMDPAEVAKGLKEGSFDANSFGANAVKYATKNGELAKKQEDLKEPVGGFARGGTIPSPKSPDSVFVAARPGETILPRGAQQGQGGSTITIPITVNGSGSKELGDMIRASTINTIQEWQRKQKYQ